MNGARKARLIPQISTKGNEAVFEPSIRQFGNGRILGVSTASEV